MIYLINCKNLCKCYNVPSPSTIKEKINKISNKDRSGFESLLWKKTLNPMYWEKCSSDRWQGLGRTQKLFWTNKTNFEKGVKKTYLGRILLFNKLWWKSWIYICERIKPDSYFSLNTKNQHKMSQILKCETWSHKTTWSKHRGNISIHWCG
jgi:hypothetical protein